MIRNFHDILILTALQTEGTPMTGYEIRNYIFSNFGYETSFGTLYPHLHKLQKFGILNLIQDKRRKAHGPLVSLYYTLTDKGFEYLKQEVTMSQKICKRLILMTEELTITA